jgi:hypothetical protein
MKFTCNFCNYSTDIKFCYDKHLSTIKHKEKVTIQPIISHKYPKDIPNEAKFTCNYCNVKFTKACNLSRHKNSCSEKNALIEQFTNQVNELNNKLDQKDEIIKQKDEALNNIIKQKDETITIMKLEIIHLKSIINNTGTIVKTSVSTMAYVIKNYKEAPALESVKDYSLLHYEQTNAEFVENLIHEHINKTLHIYVSDFIIKTYKTEDPGKQSIWNSDASRLTYIIRELINQNKIDWTVDKGGLKVIKCIIKPILDYIDEQVREYIKGQKVTKDMKIKDMEIITNKQKLANEILSDIENKVLSEDIIKYITPHFYFNKTELKGNETIEA